MESHFKIITETFPKDITGEICEGGLASVSVRKECLPKLFSFLKEKLLLNMLSDLTAVDYLGRKPRFEVVYHFFSTESHERLRVKVVLDEEGTSLASAVPFWKVADWFEREVFDMFGIRFEGHPNLKRLLMFESFQGHPLRKDYPYNKRQAIPIPTEIKFQP